MKRKLILYTLVATNGGASMQTNLDIYTPGNE